MLLKLFSSFGEWGLPSSCTALSFLLPRLLLLLSMGSRAQVSEVVV